MGGDVTISPANSTPGMDSVMSPGRVQCSSPAERVTAWTRVRSSTLEGVGKLIEVSFNSWVFTFWTSAFTDLGRAVVAMRD